MLSVGHIAADAECALQADSSEQEAGQVEIGQCAAIKHSVQVMVQLLEGQMETPGGSVHYMPSPSDLAVCRAKGYQAAGVAAGRARSCVCTNRME